MGKDRGVEKAEGWREGEAGGTQSGGKRDLWNAHQKGTLHGGPACTQGLFVIT